MATINSAQLVDLFLSNMRNRMDNPEDYRGYDVARMIPELQEVLGGLGRNWYMVIGGEEKSGKSAFAVSLLINLAQQGRKVMSVSLEMDNLQIGARMFSNMSKIELGAFHRIDVSEQQYQELVSVGEEIKEFSGLYNYGTGYIEDVVDLTRKYDPDVLVLDYAQLMNSRKKHGNRVNELEYISGMLKREISLNQDTLVIALAQLNTQTVKAGKTNESYGWHGSSAFGKDADVAMTISKAYDGGDEEMPEVRMCNIVASRHSAKASFYISFIGARSMIGASTLNTGNLDHRIQQVFNKEN